MGESGATFLKEIAIKSARDLPGEFPFTLPVIESLDRLAFTTPVTFFVGENGSGKSTLLEAIAAGMKCPSLGASDTARDPMLADARNLAKHLSFIRSKSPKRRLFFRAEDAIGFTRRLMTDMDDLTELEEHFDKTLSGYGRQLATGAMRGQRNALSSRYGDNPDARSHGEWFLEMLKARLFDNGLYLLDEPETPLSPIHQISLLSLIKDQAKRNCQFIVATHSPILMALPGARIYHFDQRIEPIDWEDVEHVAIMRAFLNDPKSFLRHLD
ncbi:MAG: AAA family ATPase [Pseudomonadales bacterium]|nr:AAA family ATPase [Pseudomonadales bacterium]